jgi:hypothetical protein
MAPEVIACDENPQATYDNRVIYYSLDFQKKTECLFRVIFGH